jgi:hypothetical protein
MIHSGEGVPPILAYHRRKALKLYSEYRINLNTLKPTKPSEIQTEIPEDILRRLRGY